MILLYIFQTAQIGFRNGIIRAEPIPSYVVVHPHPWLGLPITITPSKPIFNVTPTKYLDSVFGCGGLDLYSERFLNITKEYTDDIQIFPVDLMDKKGKLPRKKYYLINFLGLYNLGKAKNNLCPSHLKKVSIEDDDLPHAFRSTDYMPKICISNVLYDRFVQDEITGIFMEKIH